jgi:hypothetical protein
LNYFRWLISSAFCTVAVAVGPTPVERCEAVCQVDFPALRDYHSAPAAAPFNGVACPVVLQGGRRTVDVVPEYSFKRLPD